MKERPILFSDPMVRAILSGQKTQTRWVVKPQPAEVGALDDERDDQTFVQGGILRKPARYGSHPVLCPYGVPGDRLWVREAWRLSPDACDGWSMDAGTPCKGWIDYRAGGSEELMAPSFDALPKVRDWDFLPRTWRPSIHMPRWACRLVLEIVSVRVERLQNISEADAMAEGCVAVDHVQWFEGMKPMADGSRVRQEFRGEPPSDWTEVKPLSSHDPLACKAKDAFRRLWYSINGAESWAANPWVWVIEFRRAQ